MLFIFDFDSTLVEIRGVDWKKVKRDVIEYGRREGFEFDASVHLVTLSNMFSDTKRRKGEVDAIFRSHEKGAVERGEFTVYESTVPMLSGLGRLGHKTAIASNNTEPTIREIVEKGKIPVDAIMGRTSVSRPKPHPDMLFSLMERFNYPRDQTVMTGDNFWDEGAGKAAGVKTFIIKPGTLNISLFGDYL